MNTALAYCYRDATGRVTASRLAVFGGAPWPEAAVRIRGALIDGRFFVPFQVGLAELFPWGCEYPWSGGDTSLHELVLIGPTERVPTDDRSVGEFVDDLEAVPAWDCSPLDPEAFP